MLVGCTDGSDHIENSGSLCGRCRQTSNCRLHPHPIIAELTQQQCHLSIPFPLRDPLALYHNLEIHHMYSSLNDCQTELQHSYHYIPRQINLPTTIANMANHTIIFIQCIRDAAPSPHVISCRFEKALRTRTKKK